MQKMFSCNKINLSHIAGVLSQQDCAELIAIGKSCMQDALVVDDKTGEYYKDNCRRSEMAWPSKSEHPLLQKIAAGVARMTGIPESHQESQQILHYLPGGEYSPHYDAFPHGSKALEHGGNRILTVIFYLNTVKSGGETTFPELGVSVSPIPCTAIVFANLTGSRQVNPYSLHAGVPVTDGEKWISTIWIREKPYV